jgi:hypothetical protein
LPSPCNEYSDYPKYPVTIIFEDGVEYTLLSEDYLYDGAEVNIKYAGICIIGFNYHNSANLYVIGNIFLQKYYTVYDMTNF